MQAYEINFETKVSVALFAVVYLTFLVQATKKSDLDLYDLFLLSALAAIPLAFVYAPKITNDLGNFLGVEFPFVLMFGGLFVITFFALHRLTLLNHILMKRNKILTQELGILNQKLEKHLDLDLDG